MSFTVISPALEADLRIALRNTRDGADEPIPLEWSHLPESARSIALVMDDIDAPDGPFTHWLQWDLPPIRDTDGAVDASTMGVPGRNDFHGVGYAGPYPPHGHKPHRYVIHLYALDADSLPLERGATREQVDEAIRDHVIDEAQLIGRYSRP